MQINPSNAGGATILVVDDDALITLNIVDQLTELGHVALEAFSGREALAILEARPDIDAIITDYSMPAMSGLELATEARTRRPGLPVLLSTGYADLPEGIACDLPRLEKPFREAELAAKLEELLSAITE